MDWTVVREKLNTLRELDARNRQFGSSSHRYELHPCLTEEEVQSFEAHFALTLPEDYRSFLLQVGNGGAGPFYGIQPLVLPTEEDSPPEKGHPLTEPFPLSNGYIVYDLLEKVYEEDLEDDAFDEAYHEVTANAFVRAGLTNPTLLDDLRKGTVDEADLLDNGMLSLCHYGCGITLNLVVKGESEGSIWCSDLGHDVGVYPLSPEHGYDVGFNEPDEEGQFQSSPHHSFRSWYEAWLDESIQTLQKASS